MYKILKNTKKYVFYTLVVGIIFLFHVSLKSIVNKNKKNIFINDYKKVISIYKNEFR